MMKNAIGIATLLVLALAVYLLGECKFLIPYRDVLLDRYWEEIVLFGGLFYLNLAAGIYLVGRAVFLKDTGRKLAHLEKQLRDSSGLPEELSRRLTE